MGEFRVHRARFFEYLPEAIHCVAYNESLEKFAVSRSGGSIEIWSMKDNCYQEQIMPPTEDQSVEALVWCGSRLFSAGLHGDLHEHDLLTGNIKYTASSNSGPIWCLAINGDATTIAAGTEDGCVVLFNVTDYGVEYHKALDKQEGRIFSLAWYNPENLIVTGGIDNIRVWSCNSGHAIQRFTLGRQHQNKETLVWAIAVTPDFTVISGDSRGQTSFWNGRQGTLIKGVQSHKADVLCLCVNKAGDSVFSSGIDPTVTQFEYIPANPDTDWKMWVRSSVRTQHTHDVRALALTKDCVISGGVDCQLIFNNLEEKRGVKSWRRIAPIPHVPLVHTARSAKIVLLRYANYLELWKLGNTKKHSDTNGDVLPLSSRPVKLLQLKSRNNEFISCCAISNNAEWLAYSDQNTIRLFQMSVSEEGVVSPQVSLTRVRYTPPGILAAHCLHFTPDCKTLVSATKTASLQLIKVDPIQPSVTATIDMPEESTQSIHLLSVCPKSKKIATGDHTNNCHVFSIDKQKLVCTLPHMSSQPTSLNFSSSGQDVIVAYADQKIYEYSIPERKFSDWTRRFIQNLHPQWARRHSKITQIMYNPDNEAQIFLRDEQMFCIIDKSKLLPRASDKIFDKKVMATEHQGSRSHKHAFTVCSRYKYLMHLDILEDDFLLVVEQPPLTITDSLPETLKQKKFGT